jgi:glycosyltransferase involved in cell wall biosynthesis
LRFFSKIIVCSNNIRNHLSKIGVPSKKVKFIPVIQDAFTLDSKENSYINSIENFSYMRNYIFYAGAIKEEKGLKILLSTFQNHIYPNYPDIKLVIAGLMKTTDQTIINALTSKNIIYLGKKKHHEIISLMKNSGVCVNLSKSEGMPRVSLEAIALDKPVLLPRNIPEFDHWCPCNVLRSNKPSEIAKQIIEIMHHKIRCRYPIHNHFPSSVLPGYIQIFEDL